MRPLLLRLYRSMHAMALLGSRSAPDHGESRWAHPPWCAQRPERGGTLADHRGVGPRNSSGLPHYDPLALAWLEYWLVRGSWLPAYRRRESAPGWGAAHQAALLTPSNARAERDGPSLAACEGAGGCQTRPTGHGWMRGQRISVHSRHETWRA